MSEARAAGPGNTGSCTGPVQVLDRSGVCLSCSGTWHLIEGRVWCTAAEIFLNKCPRKTCSSRVLLEPGQYPPDIVIERTQTRKKFQDLEDLFEETPQRSSQDLDPSLARFNAAVDRFLKSQRLFQPGQRPLASKGGDTITHDPMRSANRMNL